MGGDVGLGGVGRNQGGDAGDCGMIAAGQIVRTVGEGRRQGETERADEVAVSVGHELEGEVVWCVEGHCGSIG